MTVNGLDVSSYQPTAFSTAGAAFVFVKCTEGTSYVNPRYAAQLAHGRSAGLAVGHYHFQHHGNTAGQLDYFAAHADVRAGDMIALDWETSGLTNADKDDWLRAAKARFPHNRVVLYTDLSLWFHVDTSSYVADGLWIADPSHPAGHPAVQHDWVFHQYSSAGGTDRNVGDFPSRAAFDSWRFALSSPTKNTTAKPEATPVSTTQIVDIPPTGDIGTVDESTASGRREYHLGYFVAHILDEQRKTNALLAQILAALAPKVAG